MLQLQSKTVGTENSCSRFNSLIVGELPTQTV